MNDTPKANMTVEDRLAEKLKTAEFAAWFGEDDLRELADKAIQLAFFTEKRNPARQYNSPASVPETLPAILVQTAERYARDFIDELAIKVIKEKLAEDPSILERALDALMKRSAEDIVLSAFGSLLKSAQFNGNQVVYQQIVENLRMRGINL